MSEYQEFIANLESIGEKEVRAKVSQGIWANRRLNWAKEWLTGKESERAEATEAANLNLTTEGNTTAQEANRIAKENLRAVNSAKNAAWTASIAAIIAAICAVFAFLQIKH